ncbi:C4-dicarboxylate ABC transporter permease [Fusobacterium necrophorum subsp. funduliforme]|uniref:TRAP transporter, DctQ-like membrane protein n=5 Tax=Fusobacterium necrophorum TaxID=859 RepID=A0AAN3VV35_9FUSO|nr:TRAP transporter small permease [Fusobacterium necrophorum]AYV94995.1 TRAP transporter small permease [Fusobacterium necrophorum subsp. funduliforme]AYZ72680.1 TRAP transporter small permease [Fusobacterium necrophorum]AZW09324.1 TRAP transporter small permease [Fusobacterium necrophorum subsp. necrophorum]EFS23508.2 TRAP transporter, DctQ-like membrane protein [Fusobacterium necrophorum D12]EJU16271.1 TRAP transporter, DctQ-like membrane protein [Fusobacterium necrophorum subsp. fundulifor
MKKILINLEEIIAGIFLLITVFSVIINVFFRSIGLGTISTSEEIATLSFVWSVYLGAVACYKRKMHIGVDMLVQMLPEKQQYFFSLLIDIFLIIINGVILYLSYIFITNSYDKPTPVLGISSNWINVALLISFFLIEIYSILFFIQNLKKEN